jgi:hypothetical protein
MNCSAFRRGLFAVLAVAWLAGSSLAFAQGTNASQITGTVIDPSGAVLPGATISAKHVASTVVTTTVTNTEGVFTLPSLPIGTYEVTITLEGFKTFVAKDVVITAGTGANIAAKLEVGGVSETVTVASSSEIMQTQSTTISSTVNTNAITKLPLTSRSAMDFVNFLPGVSTPGGNRQATINGLPQGVINITLDGINIQDNTNRSTDGFFAIVSPRLDAIEEVSVTTAGQGADAGQGAVQIKFTTRSGGNNYTGSGYHYYRSDKLNANTWFNNRSQTAKAALKQNQFGGRVGGPLMIPGLLDRGKAFFFANYEEQLQPSEATRTRNFMVPAAMTGNLTYGTSPVTLNVLAFAASRGVPATSIDPTIAKLLVDIQTAANTGQVQPISGDANVQQTTFNLAIESKRRYPTGRVDFNITDNHRFSSTINYNWFTDGPDTLNSREPAFPGFPQFAGQTSIRLGLSNSLRSTISRNIVNEARVGYSGAPVKFFDEFSVDMYTGPVANTNGFHLTFPNLTSSLTGPAIGTATPSSRDATDLSFDDTLTWLKGSHNITGGASYTMYKVWLKNQRLVPSLGFGLLNDDPALAAFSAANLQAATGVNPTTDELNAARSLFALLTGRVNSITGEARLDESGQYNYLGQGIQRAKQNEAGFYVQDQWRWRPNVTLNAGVRWSVQMPFTADADSYSNSTMEDLCGISGVDASTGYCNLFQPGNTPGKAVTQYYQLKKGTKAYDTDWNNFAPNVGVAWTPSAREGWLGTLMSDEFVVRAGWSRAYSREGMGRYTGEINSNPGGLITVNRNAGLNNIGAAPVLFSNPSALGPATFPSAPAYPLTDVVTEDVRIFDPGLEVPYADSWTAGVQRKVSTNMALEVRYVGTRSDNAFANRNWNDTTFNVVENNFANEFTLAMANLQANIAGGRGNSFAYFGPGTGTNPLPIFLAHLNAQPTANAGNAALYTGTNWTSQNFLNHLSRRNPNIYGLANTSTTGNASVTALIGNATFRNNAATAGLPANFWLTNPNKIGGAIVVLNSHQTSYHSAQVELRRRLAQGLQFQTSYVFGKAMQTVFFSHRQPLEWFRDTGDPGDLTHQFKLNVVYNLPFGQGRRFMSDANPVMERIVGGWEIGLNTRIQSGRLVDLGNVKLVGMSRDDAQKLFKLRFDDANKQVYMWPEDIIENTRRAWAVSPTTANGYSGEAPSGRYFAPPEGDGCFEIIEGLGECGGTRELVVHGPTFSQSDLRVAKRTVIKGRVNFEFAAEALNVFNKANFVPDGTVDSSTLSDYRVTGLTGTNTARVIQLVSRINW